MRHTHSTGPFFGVEAQHITESPSWRHTPFSQLQRYAGNRAVTQLIERGSEGKGSTDSDSSVDHVLSTPGTPLPADVKRRYGDLLGHDFSQVRVHVDQSAAQSARRIHAKGYTFGQHIVLGREGDEGTLAHELVHTVQQREGLAHLALNPDEEAETAAASASAAQSVIDALSQADPIAGVGNFPAAFAILDPLPIRQLFRVATELQRQFQLGVLLGNAAAATGPNRSRVLGVLRAVQLAITPAASIQRTEVEQVANDLGGLSATDRTETLKQVAAIRGTTVPSPETVEGMTALAEASSSTLNVSPAMAGTITSPVEPGPWAPPGQQPIPFYIGNEAHIGIAASYVVAHPGDLVFTNFIPLSTIIPRLNQLAGAPNGIGNLTSAEQALKPDILNFNRRHLYEIKPTDSANLGETEALMYQALLARGGIAVTLGPMTEPGTAGAIPAPAGVYLFEASRPGVITYQYRRGRLVPVPVPVEAPEAERSRRFRFELQPLTAQQQAAVVTTTGVGLMLLIMLMILGSPVGV